MTYTVTEGTQVLHDGTLHTAGDTFTAHPDEMAHAITAGWVTETQPKRQRTKPAR